MNKLLRNIRFYIILSSIILSNIIYIIVTFTIPSGNLQTIRLTQIYGLTAFTYLYLALLIGPLCYFFKGIPWKAQILKSRRAIGVSTCYFALLHASIAFFMQLGGIQGLQFLSSRYLLAISLSSISLIILLIMSLTSFDWVIRKMTVKKWKLLHRLVYIAAFFILIHALMLGSHFASLNTTIPQIILIAITLLLILEALRIDNALKEHMRLSLGPTTSLVTAGILIFLYASSSTSTNFSLSIHNQHTSSQDPNSNTIPALRGDRTKRYNVDIKVPENITPQTPTPLSFSIFNAGSGTEQKAFLNIYEKPMHLIIVDQDLKYFAHIHPQQSGNTFSITTEFPENGRYHLYTDYQPVGAIEQQHAYTLQIGDKIEKLTNHKVDKNLTKSAGDYHITLKTSLPITTKDIDQGKTIFTFEIRDKKSRQITENLMPYLSSYGHLVMINTKTYDYTHVHPLTPAKKNTPAEGKVEFMPMNIYEPIKPGIYKIFAQFNPNNKLILVEYTIQIE
jgi:DMSO/TMAO reductase YedYZ heme-binding membrane subunit